MCVCVYMCELVARLNFCKATTQIFSEKASQVLVEPILLHSGTGDTINCSEAGHKELVEGRFTCCNNVHIFFILIPTGAVSWNESQLYNKLHVSAQTVHLALYTNIEGSKTGYCYI